MLGCCVGGPGGGSSKLALMMVAGSSSPGAPAVPLAVRAPVTLCGMVPCDTADCADVAVGTGAREFAGPSTQDMQTGGSLRAGVVVAQRRSEGEGEISSADGSSMPHEHTVDLWLELQQNWHVAANQL